MWLPAVLVCVGVLDLTAPPHSEITDSVSGSHTRSGFIWLNH